MKMGSDLLQKERGIALLAVLWLTVALSAMALATSYLVRTEVEAATNRIEGEQMRFLAGGGIEAAVDTLLRSTMAQGGAAAEGREQPEFVLGQRWLMQEFPGGRCAVEVMPENAKLNVNVAPPEQLAALFRALGVPAVESAELALAIEDWRSARVSEVGNAFDAYYAALPLPYRARHAPLEQLEELLPVKGMSRELFFGRIERSPEGRIRKPPLADLLTVAPIGGGINLNYAAREVLEALPGWSQAAASRVVAFRERAPFESGANLEGVVPESTQTNVTTAPGTFYTLTATCRPPESSFDLAQGRGTRRSVRAMVEMTATQATGFQVLGWWDDWPFANEPPEEG
jgi:general secretion pathway protein K